MWYLEKFGTQDSNSSWKTIKKEQGTLSLQLTNNQLVIVHNAIVIDIISIPIGGKSVRGISRGEIMVIIDERSANIRRLRFKFISDRRVPGTEHCLDCTRHLQELFSFKDPSTSPAASTQMDTEDNSLSASQRDGDTDFGGTGNKDAK